MLIVKIFPKLLDSLNKLQNYKKELSFPLSTNPRPSLEAGAKEFDERIVLKPVLTINCKSLLLPSDSGTITEESNFEIPAVMFARHGAKVDAVVIMSGLETGRSLMHRWWIW